MTIASAEKELATLHLQLMEEDVRGGQLCCHQLHPAQGIYKMVRHVVSGSKLDREIVVTLCRPMMVVFA